MSTKQPSWNTVFTRESTVERMPYYVYIILCEGNSFYTGYTKDLDSRMKLHTNGKGARYTKMHKPKRLVHVEQFSSRSEAMKREKRVKKLNHRQKLQLTTTKTKTRKKTTKTC
jgi:putative endonuclease